MPGFQIASLRQMASSGPTRAWVAVLIGLCLLPMLAGIHGPFQLDDASNLERLHLSGISFEKLYHALFNNASGALRRPLANASLLLQMQLGAESPFTFKLVNLMLHGINGWLAWHLAGRLLPLLGVRDDRRWIALLAAAIWTLHPLQVSSALYVVQRMTLLSTLFMLLSILLALRALATPGALASAGQGLRHAIGVGLVAVLALLCKENAVLVPALLLAVLLALPLPSRELARDTAGKRCFIRIAVWTPCIAGLLMLALAWSRIEAAYAIRSFSLSDRLVTEAGVLLDYLASFFVPLPSRMGLFLDDVPVVGTGTPGWFLAPIILGMLLGSAVVLRRRFPVYAFAVLWFFACHLLESTVLPLELKFEHRNYLALFGFALLIATVVSGVYRRNPRIGMALGVATLLLLATTTMLRSLDWSNQKRFVVSELRHHPRSVRANLEMATLDSEAGDNDGAFERLQLLQETRPDDFSPLAFNMQLGCGGYPVPWRRIDAYIARYPGDVSIRDQSSYETLVGLVHDGVCVAGFDQALARQVDTAIGLYSRNGLGYGLQFFLMVKAQMEGAPGPRRALLQRAIQADPTQIGPRVQLAYLDLASGSHDEARATIAALDRMVPPWHADRLYVRELQKLLKEDRHQ